MSKDNFFPDEDYKIPTASNYMKFVEGDNTFRVLSSAIIGWEYWNTNNKPVRNKETWNVVPDDIKTEKDGSVRINHFWAFVVWNYNDKRVQILEITQKTIMKYIQGLTKNMAWGNPKGYDITINRSGSGFDTEYTCMANPPTAISKDILKRYESMSINLEALYEGKDPFGKVEDVEDDVGF